MSSVVFLNAAKAAQWVRAHHTPYLDRTLASPANAAIRTYHDTESFCTHLRDWSPEERRELTTLVRRLVDRCWSWRTMLARDRWTFLQTDDRLEDGMPHTIHSAVVLPRWLVRNLLPEAASSRSAHRSAVETLLHERVHVLQKKYPRRFDRLYRDWGYAEVVPRSEHHAQCAHLHRTYPHRTNPDTPRHWVWRNEWLPFAALRSGATGLRDCDHRLVWLRDPSHTPSWHALERVDAYTAYHGDRPHCYHPDETAAVLLAEAMVTDAHATDAHATRPHTVCPAVVALRKWCVSGWG